MVLGVFTKLSREWSINDVAKVVRSHERFRMLSEADAVLLVQHMHPLRVNAGNIVFREGNTDSNFMGLILEGKALVETDGGGLGERVVLGTLKEGDLVGEQGILHETPRTATVIARTDLVLAAVDAGRFDRLIKAKPVLGCTILTSLLRTVTRRLGESNQRLHNAESANRKLKKELELEIASRRPSQPLEPPPPLELDTSFFDPPPEYKRP